MTGSEPHRSQGSVASIDQTRTRAAEAVSTTELSQIFALMISALRNSNRNLSELCFENGDWIMREPGNSEQVRETLGHTQELRGVTTVPLAGAGQIIQDQSPASVTNMQQLLMSEEGPRTGDWLDTPGSGSEPGAGVTSSPTARVTTSPSSLSSLSSSSGDHQDNVNPTPPRNKLFVFDPHRRLYTVLQESNADLLRELSDVTDIQEEPNLTWDLDLTI